MTKRSTIGSNPLDEVIPNPLNMTIPDQHKGTDSAMDQEEEKPENVEKPAGDRSQTEPIHDVRDDSAQNLSASLKGAHQGKSTSHQEGVVLPNQPELHVLTPPSKLEGRLVELEEENLCLKWALGFILAPLVLLALLG